MYEQISRNKWKSVALIVFFMGFIFLLTWFFEYVTGWGKGGLVLAVIVAMGMAAVGYYQSDKIVLGHQPGPAGNQRGVSLTSITSSRAWPSPPASRRPGATSSTTRPPTPSPPAASPRRP